MSDIPTFRECVQRRCDCMNTFIGELVSNGLTKQDAWERLASCDSAGDGFDLVNETKRAKQAQEALA